MNKPEQPKKEIVSHDEARRILADIMSVSLDPDYILNELSTEVLPAIRSKDKKVSKEGIEKLKEMDRRATSIVSIDKHYFSLEAVGEDYRTLVLDFAKRLDKEYNCTTASEKALVDLIATAYGRYIECSRKFLGAWNIEYLSQEKNQYFGLFAKEADRAHRHFISALSMLKQLKSPGFEVNIRAQTALLGQYQQVINQDSKPEVTEVNPNDAK